MPQPQTDEFRQRVPPKRKPKQIEIVSGLVGEAPVIDGLADDSVWDAAQAITTLDVSCQRELVLKTVHDGDSIYFLVRYPDKAASQTHKSWKWDEKEEIYKEFGDREDMFVFKWSLVGNDVGLSFQNAQPHRADIWFWKAWRTNPSGFADDKHQILAVDKKPRSTEVKSPEHGTLYLQRLGDEGRSAYENRMAYEYQGPVVPRFFPREPQGSRADIRAKGRWHDDQWTIEFARSLDTGHEDDLAFELGGIYLFGTSCYEMSHTEPNPEWFQPLYKTGDTFDRLLLKVAKKGAP